MTGELTIRVEVRTGIFGVDRPPIWAENVEELTVIVAHGEAFWIAVRKIS